LNSATALVCVAANPTQPAGHVSLLCPLRPPVQLSPSHYPTTSTYAARQQPTWPPPPSPTPGPRDSRRPNAWGPRRQHRYVCNDGRVGEARATGWQVGPATSTPVVATCSKSSLPSSPACTPLPPLSLSKPTGHSALSLSL
jgi:hypothetical protein